MWSKKNFEAVVFLVHVKLVVKVFFNLLSWFYLFQMHVFICLHVNKPNYLTSSYQIFYFLNMYIDVYYIYFLNLFDIMVMGKYPWLGTCCYRKFQYQIRIIIKLIFLGFTKKHYLQFQYQLLRTIMESPILMGLPFDTNY